MEAVIYNSFNAETINFDLGQLFKMLPKKQLKNICYENNLEVFFNSIKINAKLIDPSNKNCTFSRKEIYDNAI